jgi:hypothetical protein
MIKVPRIKQSRDIKGIKSNHQKVNKPPTKCTNVSSIIMTCHSNANRNSKKSKIKIKTPQTLYSISLYVSHPPHIKQLSKKDSIYQTR